MGFARDRSRCLFSYISDWRRRRRLWVGQTCAVCGIWTHIHRPVAAEGLKRKLERWQRVEEEGLGERGGGYGYPGYGDPGT